MAQIELDQISKRFADGTLAVHELTLCIEDGEFFVLVGPSGCGKSTLLNIIVGLETPSAGEIRVDGRRCNEIDARERNMAMVFQSYAIYPHMTVRENLAFPLSVAGMGREEISQRVRRAAHSLELEDLLDKRPASLSGGQRQRVAMGRALVREPVAFLLDEPLSNLDARLRVQTRTQIARLQKRLRTTTIYVTHDQAEAMTLGDRVAVLRAGKLQQVGSPRALYELPGNLFVAGFIGSPAMNFLPGRIEGTQLMLPMLELTLPDEWRRALGEGERALIAGIRPEHLSQTGRAGQSSTTARFSVRVEVLEWMGAELFVYATLDAQFARQLQHLAPQLIYERRPEAGLPLVARLDPDSEAVEDSEIELTFDLKRLYLFDPQTGDCLLPCAIKG